MSAELQQECPTCHRTSDVVPLATACPFCATPATAELVEGEPALPLMLAVFAGQIINEAHATGWGMKDDSPFADYVHEVVERAHHSKEVRAAIAADRASRDQQPAAPIDMILHCPNCGMQHVDEPDERTADWQNPPHRSHLCHGCNHIWRPADVPTNGVQAIQTRGKNDSAKPGQQPAGAKLRYSETYVSDLEDTLQQIANALGVKGGADDLITVAKKIGAEQPAGARGEFMSAAELGRIDANRLEELAQQRPDECFLKGAGVLKLIGAIRNLEQEAHDLRAQLARQSQQAQGDAVRESATDDAMKRACRDLPDGYEIRVELENGCGMVVWYDPNGDRNFIEGEGHLSDDINEAIDAALRATQQEGKD